ncbi:MAG: 50S ribosomal protein L11 methyltransferase [Geminicoccaceae bacterium]
MALKPFRASAGDDLFCLSFTVPAACAQPFMDGLDELCLSVSVFEQPSAADEIDAAYWRVEVLAQAGDGLLDLQARIAGIAAQSGLAEPEISLAALPAQDWLAATAGSFPPLSIGRFFIHASTYDGALPANSLAIMLDAGLAFGSGEHATTAGCLEVLDHLLAQGFAPKTVLDIGTGSGILAIAAAKALPDARIIASDNDPIAMRVAAENATRNRVDDRILCRTAEGYEHARIAEHAPYALVFANILADPLIALAPDLAEHLAPDGYALLAGLLDTQVEAVMRAHEIVGLRLIARHERAPWPTLVLGKTG